MSTYNEYVDRLSNVYIGDINVIQLCLDNNIPIKNIVEKFIKHRSLSRLSKFSDSELVKPIIDNVLSHKRVKEDKCIYNIGGLTTLEYATKYYLIAQSLRTYLRKELEKNPNADLEVLANQFRRHCEEKDEDYLEIQKHCKKYGISVKQAYQIYYEEYAEKTDIPKKDALYLICDFLIDIKREQILNGRKR